MVDWAKGGHWFDATDAASLPLVLQLLHVEGRYNSPPPPLPTFVGTLFSLSTMLPSCSTPHHRRPPRKSASLERRTEGGGAGMQIVDRDDRREYRSRSHWSVISVGSWLVSLAMLGSHGEVGRWGCMHRIRGLVKPRWDHHYSLSLLSF